MSPVGSKALRAPFALILLLLFPFLHASTEKSAPGIAALDYAFRFASAIDPDPKDKAMAQEAVVLDYAAIGAFDVAIARTDDIEGWRRGTASADLAVRLAERNHPGDAERARRLVERATQVRATITDWHAQTIDARIADALALLGRKEQMRQVASSLSPDSAQFAGRPAAMLAVSHAAEGDFEGAMKALEPQAGDPDLFVTQARVSGYIAIAKMGSIAVPQRRAALEAAAAACSDATGWQKAELMVDVASGWLALEDRDRARRLIVDAEPPLRALPSTMPVKGPLLNRLAVTSARAGDIQRAKSLLDLIESEAGRTLSIDQPGILAEAAAGWRAVGDEERSRRLIAKAIASAEGLANARPRALAVVSICRSIGRQDAPLDDTVKTRLDDLYAGLKAPW